MSFFVGGKLKLKNQKANLATLKIKQQMTNSAISNLSKKQININNEVLQGVKESLIEFCDKEENQKYLEELVKSNNNIKVKTLDDLMPSNIINNDQGNIANDKIFNLNKTEIDTRTKAERKFDEMKRKKFPDKILNELQGKKKELKEKFNKILDKQLNHNDIPKVSSG